MGLYKQKSETVNAMQYGLAEYADNPLVFKNVSGDITWLENAVKDQVIVPVFKSEDYWYLEIHTKGDILLVSPDDWIVLHSDNTFSVCDDGFFKNCYSNAKLDKDAN